MDAKRALLSLVAALVTVAIDQLAKVAVRGRLELGESVHLIPGLRLTHVSNSGVAFGLFSGSGPWLVGLGVAVLLVASVLILRGTAAKGVWLPLGLLLGGTASNLCDRVAYGSVTDYIDPQLWPAFNIADAAIVAGVVGLLALYLTSQRAGRRGRHDPS